MDRRVLHCCDPSADAVASDGGLSVKGQHYRAEQVLLAVLEGRSVAVSEIQEALEELRTAQPTVVQAPAPIDDVEQLKRLAENIVHAHDAWEFAFANETGEEDFDPIWDAIAALKAAMRS